jgi:hypothetical protein
MAVPSRCASLGTLAPNPNDVNLENAGITEYELLRDKRKATLHAEVQVALVNAGLVLDDRVLRGFDGKIAFLPDGTCKNVTHSPKRSRRQLHLSVARGGPPTRRSLRNKRTPPKESSPASSPTEVCRSYTAVQVRLHSHLYYQFHYFHVAKEGI